ncbi:serine-rich adhesin for platelets-like isoform X2 [Gigantopelta aegis]|uniref:serine-rich adhesin for platelets-like isoform X2 n=1 Tax=Gigantopelta aegis TaxID=1735272 RepID=UPI001B88E06D|nr:serine-rich adhesin for platelets-like isoform X2 [Gigantopelta aegis]
MDDLDYMLPANCPNPYQDTWDRHNSIAFSMTKGLRNAPGENNCFLNSAVQVFWHLDVFRRSYRCLTGHVCMGNSCIFCALKVIFTQLQYSDQTSLHPDALRKALAETFANQQRFQLGHMDDAAECFENILRRIHLHLAHNVNEDTCNAPHCLPHQKFSMTVCDQLICPCGKSSEPLKFTQMVHYISANSLVCQARMMQEKGDILHPDRFGLLLRNASAMGDVRDCPGNCGKKVQIQRTLHNSPDIVSIGLVWDSDHPSTELTTEVAKNIGTTLLLQDVFHSTMCDIKKKFNLVALVCYYGKHYSTFVFHSKLKIWIYFDDATVREIGPRFEHVIEKCCRGRYQPLLLLYANPAATPVSVDKAPKKRTMAPGYVQTATLSEDTNLDQTCESIKSLPARRSQTPNPDHRSKTPIPEDTGRRAVTPGPEYYTESPRHAPRRTDTDHTRQPSFLIAMAGKENKSGKSVPRRDSTVSCPAMESSKYHHPGKEMLGEYIFMSGGAAPCENPQDEVDNYTLSNSDQYRRPSSLNGYDPNIVPMPLKPNKAVETQKKESFKKGKKKIAADVVRYQVDPTRYSSSSSSPSPDSPVISDASGPFKQQRQKSQNGEDNLSINSDIVSSNQHRVIKPSVHHNYENIEHTNHGPVQSGLATLPRKKKMCEAQSYQNAKQGLNRQGSMGNLLNPEGLRSLNKKPVPLPVSIPVVPSVNHSRQSSTHEPGQTLSHSLSAPEGLMQPPARPPLPPSATHERQTSSSSKSSETKKMKKKVKSSEKKQRNKAEKVAENDEGFVDEKKMYIDRSLVENILKHQGVQRQPSNAGSITSNSSIESDSLMGKLLSAKSMEGKNALSVEIPYDSVSLSSHRDSGYGSSDRNSSSSTGSGTVDPYTQYFLSRSMIVPKSFNAQAVMERAQGYKPSNHYPADSKDACSQDTQHKQTYPGYTNGHLTTLPAGSDSSGFPKDDINRQLFESYPNRQTMHPIKECSFEDSLKTVPQDLGSKMSGDVHIKPSSANMSGKMCSPVDDVIVSPYESSGKMAIHNMGWQKPPVPQKNFVVGQISGPSPSEDIAGVVQQKDDSAGNDKFMQLCRTAEDYMDQCVLAETDNRLTQALGHCENAIGCLRQAMSLGNITHQSLVYSQRRCNSCILKSRSLQIKIKQLPADAMGRRSSVTSSDSENSYNPESGCIRQNGSRDRLGPGITDKQCVYTNSSGRSGSIISDRTNTSERTVFPDRTNASERTNFSDRTSDHENNGQNNCAPHSRQVSTSSEHSQMSSRGDNSQKTMNRTTNCDQSGVPSHCYGGSNSSVHSSSSQSSSHRSSSQENLIDAYATLPRPQKGKKPPEIKTSESEVYKSYLNKQKSLQNISQVQHVRSSSGSSTTNSIEGSDSSGSGRKKMSQSEIRELLEKNYVQRHQSQITQWSANKNNQQQLPEQNRTTPGQGQMQPGCGVVDRQSTAFQGQASSGSGCRQMAAQYQGQGQNGYRERDLQPGTEGQGYGASDYQHMKQQGQTGSGYQQSRCQQMAFQGQGQSGTETKASAESHPDLRYSTEPSVTQKDTLQQNVSKEKTPDSGDAISVKALASRFETVTVGHESRRPVKKSDSNASTVSYRVRSKSESSSKKPKSALKTKKGKSILSRPRKSVTFCDNIALIAMVENGKLGYESASEKSSPRVAVDDRAYYSDDEDLAATRRVSYSDTEVDDVDDSSNSDDSPAVVAGELLCNLCQKKGSLPGYQFCSKCYYYMNRVMPPT